MEYAATVWDPFTQANIDSMEAIQRRAARFVLRRYRNTSSVSNNIWLMNWDGSPGQTPNCSPYHAVQNSTRNGLHEQHDREITACCRSTKKRPHLPICATNMPHTIPTTVVFTTNNPDWNNLQATPDTGPEHCGGHNHRHFRVKGLQTGYVVFILFFFCAVPTSLSKATEFWKGGWLRATCWSWSL